MTSERLTVPALVRQWAEESPDHGFVVTDDAELTYGRLDDRSAHVAARLVAAGVGKGSRVGLLMGNGVDWAVTAVAVMRLGAVLVPLSTLLRPPELADHLRTAGVEHLLCVRGLRTRSYLDDLAEISPALTPGVGAPLSAPELPRLRSILVWEEWLPGGIDGLSGASAPADEPFIDVARAFGSAISPADDMVVIFTSGSSGTPKGVIHTHGGALGATSAGLGPRCVGPDDRLYIPMPMFWMGGFGGGLITALVAGATLVTDSGLTPAATLDLLERRQVTLFRGWPDQAAAIAADPSFGDRDLSSLRTASLPALLPPEATAGPGRRPVLFGMTESFGPYCADRLDRDLPVGKQGALGRPFSEVDVRIVVPETGTGTGTEAPTGETGEIELRGPNMMRGICGRDREDLLTADGFYRTGDLGRLDEDGYLYFLGRLDDMFKVKGATVYPAEVETALRTLPGVEAAFVTEISAEGSPAVGAAIVLRPDSGATATDIEREARATVSSFKVPTRWAVLSDEEVPRGTTGKVDRAALRKLLESR